MKNNTPTLPIIKEEESPVVSVIMNCYNGEKYLKEAIDSVLAQTYQNWEIIFWDNRSTDRSAEFFKSYQDPRLKYFYAPRHTLLYEGRNYAIEKASGEFIAFLDVDDYWTPDKLEKQIPLFDDPEVGFVCSKYWIVKENLKKTTLSLKKNIPSGWVLNELLLNYPVGLLTLVVRRTAFDGLQGGCDPRFHIIGDLDLVVRLAQKWKMTASQKALAYYRIHENNEGQKQKARHVEEYQIWLDELGKKTEIQYLTGYKKVIDECIYMQGRLCLDHGQKREALRHWKSLCWPKYKIKLFILILKSSLL